MLECLTDVLCTYATAIVEDSLNRKPQDIKKNESWYVEKLLLPLNLAASVSFYERAPWRRASLWMIIGLLPPSSF